MTLQLVLDMEDLKEAVRDFVEKKGYTIDDVGDVIIVKDYNDDELDEITIEVSAKSQ